VVTFLFTDLEGSTRRWETGANAMRAALGAHDEALRTAIEAHWGWLFKHTGDGVCAAFSSPKSAVDGRGRQDAAGDRSGGAAGR
jgi:class 3 adenylate cyclase